MVNLPTWFYRISEYSAGNTIMEDDGYTTSNGSYGWFCPDISTVLLNASALDLTTAQGIRFKYNINIKHKWSNNQKLFNVIVNGKQFALNSEETITSDFVFVRARNSEFNYSENPFIYQDQRVK